MVTNRLVSSSDTCGFATASVGARSGSIPLSGGTIPALSGSAAGQCQIQIGVVSSNLNTYLNTLAVGEVSSSEGSNSQAAQATLEASTSANLTGSKVFAPTNVHGGGTASTSTNGSQPSTIAAGALTAAEGATNPAQSKLARAPLRGGA